MLLFLALQSVYLEIAPPLGLLLWLGSSWPEPVGAMLPPGRGAPSGPVHPCRPVALAQLPFPKALLGLGHLPGPCCSPLSAARPLSLFAAESGAQEEGHRRVARKERPASDRPRPHLLRGSSQATYHKPSASCQACSCSFGPISVSQHRPAPASRPGGSALLPRPLPPPAPAWGLTLTSPFISCLDPYNALLVSPPHPRVALSFPGTPCSANPGLLFPSTPQASTLPESLLSASTTQLLSSHKNTSQMPPPLGRFP